MPAFTFKNFLAGSRKANMPYFGMFAPNADISWIENYVGKPAGEVPLGTPDGETAAFTLSITPPNGLMLFLAGAGGGQHLFQIPGVAYTLSGNVITFKPGYIPAAGASLFAVVW